jgi:hypothetical protein
METLAVADHDHLTRIAAGIAFFLLVALLLWRRWRTR